MYAKFISRCWPTRGRLRLHGAWAGLGLTLALAGGVTAQTAPSGPIEVRPGDTFSAIAAPWVGGARNWHKLYDAQRGGLSDPNRIAPGMRFELVTEGPSRRYLRLLPSGSHDPAGSRLAVAVPVAKAAPPSPAAAPAPKPAPVAAPTVAEPDTLVIGVLPNISAATLMGQYENLKSYLERGGAQKVRIVLPADFKAFFDNTMNGDYDLSIGAPHFARVAQIDRKMVPMGMYEPRINALFVTPADTKMTTARDAREKVIAFANPTSLVAMFGQQWLRGQGLEPGKDCEVRGARTDLGVGRMLLSGDAVAAVMSNGEFRALPPEESSRLKILESFATIPNFILLANPRLSRERQAALRGHLRVFFADKDDGVAFARATNLSGIVDADEPQLRELDAHAAATRRLMGVTK